MAALGADALHLRGVQPHRAGDRHQVALALLVIDIAHLAGLEGAFLHHVVGAQQVGQVGVHLQPGQDDAAGLLVTLVVVQASAASLDLINAAPDGRLLEHRLIHLADVLKGQRVKHDKAVQAVGVALPPVRIVQQRLQAGDAPADDGEQADQNQYHSHQTQKLPGQAAVVAKLFLS